MKVFRLYFVLVLCFSLGSCCLIFNQDCDDCDKIEAGIELADLVLSNFESEITQSEEGETAFNIIHTVLNIADGFECPEEVNDAGGHKDMLEMVFSSTENFENPVVVGTREAVVSQSTSADSKYQVMSEVVFESDGFYSIRNAIDNEDDVPERDEGNNGSSDTPRSTTASFVLDYDQVIHVTKEMIKTSKYTDNQQIFISSWKVNVSYQ